MLRRQLLPAIVLTILACVVLGIVYPLVVFGIGQVAFRGQAEGSLIAHDGRIVGSSLLGQQFSGHDGQPLPQYFQPRPSAAGAGYDGLASGASNLGPGDPRLVGFIPGFNTVSLNGKPSKTNPFASPSDPYCVPLSTTGVPVSAPSRRQRYARTAQGRYVCDPNTVPERTLAYRAFNDLGPRAIVPVDAVTASASGLDPDVSIANAKLQAPRVARTRHMSLGTVLRLLSANTSPRPLGFLGEAGVNVVELNLALDRQQQRG